MSAFAKCSSLNSIVLSNTVSYIGERAFEACTNLNNIQLSSNIEVINKHLFEGCISLKYISLPQNITKIAYKAFCNNSSLVQLTIPDNVVEIEEYAFSNCCGLSEIVLPQCLTKIPKGCFDGCTNINDIVIPANVNIIESLAISRCHKITSISFPISVEDIEEYAISDCKNLQSVFFSKTIDLASNSLYNLPAIKNIWIPQGTLEYFEDKLYNSYCKDFLKELENEEAVVLLNLAKAHYAGIGVAQNKIQAILYFQQASNKGSAEASYILAELYIKGEILAKDLDSALIYYTKAALSCYRDSRQKVDALQAEIAQSHIVHTDENSVNLLLHDENHFFSSNKQYDDDVIAKYSDFDFDD
jgi:hypothetical protein